MKNLYLLALCFFTVGILTAQEELSKEEKERREKNIQAANPFVKFGYKAKVATLSQGKYLEVHDLDSIVTIGTIRWHVDDNKIVGFLVPDTTDIYSQPIGDIFGRWMSPDPLSDEFPEWSPYTSMNDNPVNFIDPDGRAAFDIIDIEKNSGEITVTAAAGNDIVRSVDNGTVNDSYTYGENGSFKSDNAIIGSKAEGVQVLVSSNVEKSTQFYEFAADNSNVEFARLEVSKNDKSVSAVSTTFSKEANSFQNDFAKYLANDGYSITEHSHSHPGQDIGVPSGYYGIEKGNSNSLTPIPNFKTGDAAAARIFSKYPQFKSTEFNIYNGSTKTIYNGFTKAKVVPNN